MATTVKCPNCEVVLTLPPTHSGRGNGVCPKCKVKFDLGLAQLSTAPAPKKQAPAEPPKPSTPPVGNPAPTKIAASQPAVSESAEPRAFRLRTAHLVLAASAAILLMGLGAFVGVKLLAPKGADQNIAKSDASIVPNAAKDAAAQPEQPAVLPPAVEEGVNRNEALPEAAVDGEEKPPRDKQNNQVGENIAKPNQADSLQLEVTRIDNKPRVVEPPLQLRATNSQYLAMDTPMFVKGHDVIALHVSGSVNGDGHEGIAVIDCAQPAVLALVPDGMRQFTVTRGGTHLVALTGRAVDDANGFRAHPLLPALTILDLSSFQQRVVELPFEAGKDLVECTMEASADASRLMLYERLAGIVDPDVPPKVWIFDTSSGSLVREFTFSREDFRTATISPDGRHLLAGKVDGTVELWDVDSGSRLDSQRRQTDPVMIARYSPDGTKVVTKSETDHAVWDAGEKLQWKFRIGDTLTKVTPAEDKFAQRHFAMIRNVRFSDDGQMVQLIDDKCLSLWSSQQDKLVGLVERPAGVEQLKDLASDLEFAAILQTEGTRREIQRVALLPHDAMQTVPHEIRRHEDRLLHSRFLAPLFASDKVSVVAEGRNDSRGLFTWAAAEFKTKNRKKKVEPLMVPKDLATTEAGVLVTAAAADADRIAFLVRELAEPGTPIVALWDGSKSFKHLPPLANTRIDCMALSRNGQQLAIGTGRYAVGYEEQKTIDPAKLLLWNAKKKNEWMECAELPAKAAAIAFSSSEKRLAIACGQNDDYAKPEVVVLDPVDPSNYRRVIPLDGRLGIAFLNDDQQLAVVGRQGVQIVEVERGTVVRQWDHPPVLSPHGSAFSPDGSLVAVVGFGHNGAPGDHALVYELNSGSVRTVVRWLDPEFIQSRVDPESEAIGSEALKYKVAISSDNRFLYLANDDDVVLTVWDINHGADKSQQTPTKPDADQPDIAAMEDDPQQDPAATAGTSAEYEGHPLEYWLQEANSSDVMSEADYRDVVEALQSLGQTEPAAVLKLAELADHRQGSRAVRALGSLGPRAAPALPTLLKLLAKRPKPGPSVQEMAAAIGDMGPDAADAVDPLFALLSDPKSDLRFESLTIVFQALGRIGEPAVGKTLKVLGSSNNRDVYLAALTLGELAEQPSAEQGLDLLVRMLNSNREGPELRVEVSPNADAKTRKKALVLEFKYAALIALGKFGERAGQREDVSLVVTEICCTETSEFLRGYAHQALASMRPQFQSVKERIDKAIAKESNSSLVRDLESLQRTINPIGELGN